MTPSTTHMGPESFMPEPTEAVVSVLVAGDLCTAGRPEQAFARNEPYAVWGELGEILCAHDLRVVNLECPLTLVQDPSAKSGPHLRSRPSCALAIRTGGFDLVGLANNHIMDHRERGLADTLDACRTAGLLTVGAGLNLGEAEEPVITEAHGRRVAILAFAEREFSIATEKRAGACPLDLPLNLAQLQHTRELADTVIVLLHGGNEYYPLPSPYMVKTCRYLIDAGADAVMCSHTHVSSGIETYRGAPIAYGLGNFLFDWPSPQPTGWYYGTLASLTIDQSGAITAQLIPFKQCMEAPVIELETGDQLTLRRARNAELSSIVASPDRLESAWRAFCATQRVGYLARLLSLTRLERGVLSRGVWPTWRTREARLYELLDVLTCDAHRQAAISILEAELEARRPRHIADAGPRNPRECE